MILSNDLLPTVIERKLSLYYPLMSQCVKNVHNVSCIIAVHMVMLNYKGVEGRF